jgi:hypothetical protein
MRRVISAEFQRGWDANGDAIKRNRKACLDGMPFSIVGPESFRLVDVPARTGMMKRQQLNRVDLTFCR